ncbi:glycosyltransferase family 61 protein [Dulcicalothrix desertica]|nr:glycosyltransferase family 61 protein [Dulcicalothrix desertica]TWH61820.1 uncharacterized protein DUF563 [Dulcicalothrix desertica PCC 7102]
MKSLLVALKNVLRQFPFIMPKGIVYSAKDWINENNYYTNWCTQTNSSWYINAYPENIIYYSKPNSIYNELNVYFKSELIKKHLEVNLYYFQGAYVFSDYGNVISKDNKVFDEFCHYFGTNDIKKGNIFKPFATFKTQIEKIKSNTAVIATPDSSNYYHWMMDSLPRLHLLEKFIDSIDYFIVPEKLYSFHIESLKYWGIEEDRLIKMKKTDKIYFENLYVPSLPGSVGNSPLWAVEYVRQKFINDNNDCLSKEYVYLSRINARERHIINENEVIELLRNRGFQIYEMSEHTLAEQIKIIRNAKIIVSAHGAALTNLLFASNCQVLEIFSLDCIRPDCYFTLASQLGLDYWYLMGENYHDGKKLAWGDMYLNTNNLTLTLDKILS